MLLRKFPATASHATICAYFWAGIAVGLIPFERSKDWACSIIELAEKPPIEIIDIATALDRNRCMDALQAGASGADSSLPGRWLLGDLHQLLESGVITTARALQMALRIAQTTDLPRSLCFEIDVLEDELALAINGAYGDPAQVEASTLSALAEFADAT